MNFKVSVTMTLHKVLYKGKGSNFVKEKFLHINQVFPMDVKKCVKMCAIEFNLFLSFQNKMFYWSYSSFPVIHKVGNVDLFVLFKSEKNYVQLSVIALWIHNNLFNWLLVLNYFHSNCTKMPTIVANFLQYEKTRLINFMYTSIIFPNIY